MKNKFTNVYLEILNTTLQLLKLNWAVFFFAHSQIFLVGGSSLSTEGQFEAPEKSVADPCKTSVTQSSQTRVLYEVALLVFCGIFASFLAWISLSLTVMIPRPESSLSVKTSVKKILGA